MAWKSFDVSSPWYEHIRDGRKTVEGRLCKGLFAGLRAGDKIKIDDKRGSYVCARVIEVRRYPTFEEYLSQEGLRITLPGVRSLAEGVAVYRRFYSVEKEREFGICAIHLQKTRCFEGGRPRRSRA
jgi:ASC-1-like (ASCH) protein